MRDRQQLNHGFGDGMSRAFEMAVTPLIFGAIGFWIDHVLGTGPLFTISLAVFAVIGMFVKTWIGYDAQMRAHEAELSSNRRSSNSRSSNSRSSNSRSSNSGAKADS